MTMGYSDDERAPRKRVALRARQALDVLVYAVAVTAAFVAASALVSFPVGSGWVGVKFALFFLGFFLFGISTFQLRPKSSWKRDDEEPDTPDERTETGFQALVQRIPPLGRYGLPPDDRLSPAAKLFAASLFVLLVSFVMETTFGVAA